MIKIALPNKGTLSEDSVCLMTEADYACRRYNRELFVHDKKNEIDFVFLRPRDIAVYVSKGIIDIGITGRDLAHEADVVLDEVLSLGFGQSKFCYAVPRQSSLTPDNFNGLRIATSYPHLVKKDLAKRQIQANVVKLDGAVEISVTLGVADVIADVVQSGRTLTEAGLKIVGSPILESEALVIASPNTSIDIPTIKICLERLRGIVVAREYVMVEYDAPKNLLEKFCSVTPGIESPTIAPLSKSGWVAVKAMVKQKHANKKMDELTELGAKGIIVTNIRTCRL
ncbi:MAG: ATP phosphoribosyltransferase [Desulfobacteraceae bacterium]|nr:ATP phosphoribosyltransferase [Desulfobacteraceae bacterium]MBC2757147.1 ATP phosphoribosyltransferase [Desulfobacteraceae bacterium]